MNQRNIHSNVRALVAGGAASLVGQTIIVPFDVLSQHLMMMGVNGKEEKVRNPFISHKNFQDKFPVIFLGI